MWGDLSLGNYLGGNADPDSRFHLDAPFSYKGLL